jgi:hypothetical protein
LEAVPKLLLFLAIRNANMVGEQICGAPGWSFTMTSLLTILHYDWLRPHPCCHLSVVMWTTQTAIYQWPF